jgi:hypothetical protein
MFDPEIIISQPERSNVLNWNENRDRASALRVKTRVDDAMPDGLAVNLRYRSELFGYAVHQKKRNKAIGRGAGSR